jgi:hypothetical protein
VLEDKRKYLSVTNIPVNNPQNLYYGFIIWIYKSEFKRPRNHSITLVEISRILRQKNINSLFLFIYFCGAGDQTQALSHARHVLYHCSTVTDQLNSSNVSPVSTSVLGNTTVPGMGDRAPCTSSYLPRNN